MTAPLPGGTPLLELRAVSAGYGPYRALFDVSLEVAEASTVALLGPNGAGKTTVARLCSGLVRPTSGRVVFAGAEITGLPPWRIARAGVSHAPEGRSVFASLTVEENLALELASLGRRGMASALARAYDLFPQLSGRRRQLAGTLSGGEQRMLMLARVLAHPPRLLVVDELSLGLAPVVLEQVYATLHTVRDAGTSMLVIEQHASHALALADRVVVLDKGTVMYAGPTAELGDLSTRFLG